MRRQLFGEQHEDVAQSLNSIGNTYCNLKNYNEAQIFFN